jgi:hypothetical protein
MARYIDVDTLYKEIHKMDFYIGSELLVALVKVPYADVVEVVRCEKCKHANDDGTICRYSVGRAVEPEHFCSYGKRRDT